MEDCLLQLTKIQFGATEMGFELCSVHRQLTLEQHIRLISKVLRFRQANPAIETKDVDADVCFLFNNLRNRFESQQAVPASHSKFNDGDSRYSEHLRKRCTLHDSPSVHRFLRATLVLEQLRE